MERLTMNLLISKNLRDWDYIQERVEGYAEEIAQGINRGKLNEFRDIAKLQTSKDEFIMTVCWLCGGNSNDADYRHLRSTLLRIFEDKMQELLEPGKTY
jgi:hypothetical protein